MRESSLSNQLLFTTARLMAISASGVGSISTGFLVSVRNDKGIIPFLVTAAHGIESATAVELALTKMASDAKPKLGDFVRINLSKRDILSAAVIDKILDICVIPFAPVLTHAEAAGTPLFVKPIDLEQFISDKDRSDLNALEDLVFVGYPKGLYDDVNMLPIFRKGVSASPIWANFQGRPTFLVDAEVFPGSSGSPVFILNEGAYPVPGGLSIGTRFYFVGMILQALNDQLSSQHIGLGAVVSAAAIAKHLNAAVKKLFAAA